jgi:hypothetical protein
MSSVSIIKLVVVGIQAGTYSMRIIPNELIWLIKLFGFGNLFSLKDVALGKYGFNVVILKCRVGWIIHNN